MIISKEQVTRVVDDCYSSHYKIFSINSLDGLNLCRPIGLFVSLGITTSLATMKTVSDTLAETLGVDSRIAEISTKMIEGRYLNKVLNSTNVEQYDSGVLTYGKKLKEEDINNLLADLKSKWMENKEDTKVMLDYSYRLSKVSKLIHRIKSSKSFNWGDYSINLVNTDTEFSLSIVNNKINYIQCTENVNGIDVITHKRVGVLVNF